MRYRWKLLILLLTIALLPLLTGRTLGLRLVRLFEDKIVAQTREELASGAENEMRLMVESSASLIRSSRKRTETALIWQQIEVERALATSPEPAEKIYLAPLFRDESTRPPDAKPSRRHMRMRPSGKEDELVVSYSQQVFHLAPNATWNDVQADIYRLMSLTPIYRAINSSIANIALWHYTSLTDGLHSAYPGHEGVPAGMDARLQAWFLKSDSGDQTIWTTSYIDPETRNAVIAASRALHRPNGEFAGTTSIIIPFTRIMEESSQITLVPEQTRVFVSVLQSIPDSDEQGLLVAAGDSMSKVQGRSWRTMLETEWLQSSDQKQLREMISDCAAGKSGARRMPYKGRDSLWVYGPILEKNLNDNPYLTLIAPYDEILAPTRKAEENIQHLMNNLTISSQLGMFGVVILVIVLAFSFSRTVTKPLLALAEAAKRLASGDFDIQVDTRSRDELGDLSRMFNSVGPRLKEHYKMSQSLHLAREVQQSLMPRKDPEYPGLDLAGISIYCDETGGDYYDYIEFTEADRKGLAVVVGDVSDHGIQSALLMASARAFLRQRAAISGTLASVISDVNRQLSHDVEDSGRFMTMFFCLMEPEKNALRFVNAGHDPAFVFDRTTETFSELTGSQGLALGVLEDFEYQEDQNEIKTGQIVVIGTDGIWETHDSQDRMLGKDAFRQVIKDNAHLPAAEIVNQVVKTVEEFRGRRDQEDDVTLVVIKVL